MPPELPEVETFVRGLRPIVGTRIVDAEVLDGRLAVSSGELVGASIRAVTRRGKHIVIGLEGGGDLVVHLRMSGRLRLDRGEDEGRYTRMELHLDSGDCVYFVDPRRLGTAVVCPSGFAEDLGLEPTAPAFTPAALAEIASRSRAPIKPLLLDQRKVAGLGNIYAAESLWRAGIAPQRRANMLDAREIEKLHAAIRSVLTDALGALGTTLGSSVSDYRRSATDGGSFQDQLAVYGREGHPCRRCGADIVRTIQAGRSTYCCPACQT